MTQEEIEIIKNSIKELNLDKNYYNDLRRNSKSLYETRKLELDYAYFDEDGNYVDKYNPDAYNVVLYLIHDKDKLYLGNEQIPTDLGDKNKQRTVNMIEYWFRGNNSNYIILHEFTGVHNKSISYRGCGCNQALLNVIKMRVINAIKTNLNVNDVGEVESSELQKQYGKIISRYKANTRKLLKSTDISDFSNMILCILNDIELNTNIWMNMLYEKNRYWLISENDEDKKEREQFFNTYVGGWGEPDDDLYKAVLIIFKEYLLWQTCENYTGHYYQTIFSKKNYIVNTKCKASDIYDWKKMWDNSKPIDIILSICYKNVFEGKIIKDKANYKAFRNNLYKNIEHKKNNDK